MAETEQKIVSGFTIEIDPNLPENDRSKAARCMEPLEDSCVVTQSVRGGIDVAVRVKAFEPSASAAYEHPRPSFSFFPPAGAPGAG
jgi:hypothetical protein